MKQIFIKNLVIQFVLLFGFWLLLSGHYDFFHISMGVFSSLLVILINFKLRRYFFFQEEIDKAEAVIKDYYQVRMNLFRLLFYIPWLLWQIVIASLQVAYAVLSPKMPIDPSIILFKTKLPCTVAKVILGNSITLTPGTITVQISGDDFIVHALMDVSSSGIISGTLPEQVAKLYEKKPGQIVSNVEIIKSKVDI